MAFIYDLTDTWNAGGTTFNAIKMNVTDSASAAASKLVTLQVGGVERFGIRKDGQGYFAGNVGIGTASPSERLDTGTGNVRTQGLVVSANQHLIYSASSNELGLRIGSAGPFFGIGTTGSNNMRINCASGGDMLFAIASTERARITSSGNLLVGTSSAEGPARSSYVSTVSTTACISYRNTAGAGSTFAYFLNGANTAQIGTITNNGNTGTLYNTSSDYRLKDIDGPIANSGAYIDALKPVQGSWKADGSRFIGLLAHEAQEVSETQIATGEKDGEQMQAMDYSAPEIIANLIAELQSLRARVAQLEGN